MRKSPQSRRQLRKLAARREAIASDVLASLRANLAMSRETSAALVSIAVSDADALIARLDRDEAGAR